MWKIHNIIVNKYIIILTSLFILSCTNTDVDIKQEVSHKTNNSTNDTIFPTKPVETIEEVFVGELEGVLIAMGLVDIQNIDSTILIDVRYSSLNNFMKEDVYTDLERIYLQPTVAIDLKKCNEYLNQLDSSLVLLVYDGVRPRSVQQKMWDILDMPIGEKTKFVSNPKNGSIHNYGCAVDLTIANLNGDTLDMGAGYDDIRKIAYPRHEARFLENGELTVLQINSRKLLRKVMKKGGFYNIQTEWWHFNRYNRSKAKTLFQIIE
jgi:D-alanyl-D-alanine dipeptidase